MFENICLRQGRSAGARIMRAPRGPRDHLHRQTTAQSGEIDLTPGCVCFIGHLMLPGFIQSR